MLLLEIKFKFFGALFKKVVYVIFIVFAGKGGAKHFFKCQM